ncbi:MAG: hypothetical protein DSM106950_21060 [Stigonema ocellatum SAG 48.90 = DSM 106950]|nr:hypothetical protein [Stigonema ocellatum SAG 48.90 = DSM 106950]
MSDKNNVDAVEAVLIYAEVFHVLGTLRGEAENKYDAAFALTESQKIAVAAQLAQSILISRQIDSLKQPKPQ